MSFNKMTSVGPITVLEIGQRTQHVWQAMWATNATCPPQFYLALHNPYIKFLKILICEKFVCLFQALPPGQLFFSNFRMAYRF